MNRPKLTFRFTVRDKTSEEFTVHRADFAIGRSAECRVRVPFPEVSRQHCQVTVEGGRIRFRDLRPMGSGIWHNGRMEREGEIRLGDKLFIGYTCMELIDFEPAEGAAPGLGAGDSKAVGDVQRHKPKGAGDTAIMAALPKEIPSEMSMSMSTTELFDALLEP